MIMRGYVECPDCKGSGVIKHILFLIPIKCKRCKGLGSFWVDNIDEYFKKK